MYSIQQEQNSSFTYNYIQDVHGKGAGRRLPISGESQYEVPISLEGQYEVPVTLEGVNEEPFWEPSSTEDELRKQLQYITLSEENIT